MISVGDSLSLDVLCLSLEECTSQLYCDFGTKNGWSINTCGDVEMFVYHKYIHMVT